MTDVIFVDPTIAQACGCASENPFSPELFCVQEAWAATDAAAIGGGGFAQQIQADYDGEETFYMPERFGSLRQMNLSPTHCKLLQRVWRDLRAHKYKQQKRAERRSKTSVSKREAFKQNAVLGSMSARATDTTVVSGLRYETAGYDSNCIDPPMTHHAHDSNAPSALTRRGSDSAPSSSSSLPAGGSEGDCAFPNRHLLNRIILDFVDNAICELKSRDFRAQFAEHCRRFGRHVAAVFRGTSAPAHLSDDADAHCARHGNRSTPSNILTNPHLSHHRQPPLSPSNYGRSRSAGSLRYGHRNEALAATYNPAWTATQACPRAWDGETSTPPSSLARAPTNAPTTSANGPWSRDPRAWISPASQHDAAASPPESPTTLSMRAAAAAIPPTDSLISKILAEGPQSPPLGPRSPPSQNSTPQNYYAAYRPNAGEERRERRGRSMGTVERRVERAVPPTEVPRPMRPPNGNPLAETYAPQRFLPPRNAERYRALYAYKPQHDDELELIEGDLVYVVRKCDDGWFIGTLERTGQFGTFPGNYIANEPLNTF